MNQTPQDRLLYAPPDYAARDPAEIVRRHPFGLLITTGAEGALATSTPMFFEREDEPHVLVGHLAGLNPQAAHLQHGGSALAVFSGPHAYISARWYRSRPTVPTWNYVCAHVRGRIEQVSEPAAQLEILKLTARVLEGDQPAPWTLDQAPPGRVEFLLPQIRAFRIVIERIEGVTKLSQTHPPDDRRRVVRRLLERNDGGSLDIARLMIEQEEE